jgi:bifunctional UDP-N-acetylglucosamine pyrophosphorylase/glucosamine-1-phosphate N-acetyltransferase
VGSLATVILAAGKGKRMKSELAKVLHPVCGRPMVSYVIQTAKKLGSHQVIVVVGYQRERVVQALLGEGVEFAVQAEQLGTAHALLQASRVLEEFQGELLVLSGDTPLLSEQTVSRLLGQHRESGAMATVLTAILEDPFGYGRVLRTPENMLEAIVEEKDASEEQRAIKEINTGTYCFQAPSIFGILSQIGRDNRQDEFYLTDAIAILRLRGLPVAAVVAENSWETLGVNSVDQLLAAEKIMARQKEPKN